MKDIRGKRSLRQVKPLLFENDSGGMLAFKTDKDGRIYMKYANPVSYSVKDSSSFADLLPNSPYAAYTQAESDG